ncbi:unnamed protein product [Caenorhabditis angaria]|uniref:GRIP domain-containing protein n=1 Tax=Caenorhabditis angaria TaxID=860376 RepID=A0A9P1IZZ9_9PELO|nr:unnamed protein product [Caenorhabditis angaria]
MIRPDDISADDELAAPSTSQSNGEQPKKGILKRPSIVNEEKRDKLFPLAGFRSSPDRFPDKGSTRIPKLQVTWWEKNAVAFISETSDEANTDSEQVLRDLGNGRRTDQGMKSLQIRQTAILDSDDSDMNEALKQENPDVNFQTPDFDETMSVTSSTGSATSAVVGRWWTGKDTRYVPHCVKKGCNHANHPPPGEYVTPTQRRNKELAQLKKELRQALTERDEKEKHLSDLRDKVKEIEVFNETQSTLVEGQKMMRKEQLEREALEKEKKLMEKKHAVRVNQLIQETMAAREEIVKLTSKNSFLEELLGKPRCEAETQTDIESDFMFRGNPPDPTSDSMNQSQHQNQIQVQNLISQTIQADTPISPMMTLERVSSPAAMSPSPIMIPLTSPGDSKGQTMYCSQEALNHIQACQNEAFIWRNKAAQLEIVAKEQILKIGQLEEEIEKSKNKPRSENHAITVTQNAFIVEDMSNQAINTPVESQHEPILITDCHFEACIESKNVMKHEIEHLRQVFDDGKKRIRELEEDVNQFRKELDNLDDEKVRLEESLVQANLDIESKSAEIVASLNTANRLQQEKDNMHRAIDYMEERMQVYRNTLQENDLVVTDENSSDWRRTMSDPRFNVMNSKIVQTTLTSQQLSDHESDFLSTQQTLHELQKEFNAKNSNISDKFKEVEDILLTKTELVETLTKQLEEIRKNQTKDLDHHQSERDQYKKSLEEVTLVAEKVPILEAKISNLSKEKNEIEAELKKHMESFEDELSQVLEESLAKNRLQSDYWDEKIKASEIQITKLRNENAGLLKDLEDQKMQAHLQKAELQKKLISSIEHVEELQGKCNKHQRDVECQAIPRQINKYVGCKPNVKTKETQIEKGSLFDENEERLRICKAELETTRRQVTVLQQKLVTVIQQQGSLRNKRKNTIVEEPSKIDVKEVENNNKKQTQNSEDIETKVRELELRNTELMERINTMEAEKFVASSMEKTRIQNLVNEFDNLRTKLDNDMSNYSKEKQWLQWRISNLERDNSDLQKFANRRTTDSTENDEDNPQNITFRKAMSEPDFGDESEEGSQLNVDLDNSAELVTLPPIVNQQPFSQLADVLNLVRSDLEQVLTEFEEPEVKANISKTQSQISLDESTDILKDVLNEWAEDERKQLERQLKRSKEERNSLKNTNDRLSKDLQTAMAELNIYRLEKPQKDSMEEKSCIQRSSSFTNFCEDGVSKDVLMWKARSGTLFREVNRIRQDLSEALKSNNDLRYQLTIARGERELSSCFENHPLSPSLSFHTARDVPITKDQNEVIVHEPSEPFQLGSSKASLSASIMIRSQSLDRKHSVSQGRGRSRSANRKPPISKDELEKREKRRELRLPKNVSRSSSVTSLYVTAKEQKTPIMSASWHEKAFDNNELFDCDTDYDRRNCRVVSLREKVGKLTRENRELNDKLRQTSDISRVIELEKETDELKSTVKELLNKMSMSTPGLDKEIKFLRDELEIRRKESSMYEKKLAEVEEERKEMYLLMFKKGQQAASMELKDDRIMDSMTEDRITLKFLHDAFYYYLLNRGDSQEHLSVMMTILGFTSDQKSEVANRKRGRSN